MKALHAFAGAVAVVILVSATAAQTRPDFSGVWKPIEAASTPSPPPPPGAPPPPPPPRTLSLTIAQSASEFRIERRVDVDGRELVYVFIHKLDGSESVNQMGSVVLRTRPSWNGPTLVLSSTASVEDKPMGQIEDVYRLEGDELVIDTTRETPSGIFTATSRNRRN